nr:IS1 family transposase [Vibrio thalassae]
MATIQVQCRFCGKTEPICKHGKGHSGFPRFRCIECRKRVTKGKAYCGKKIHSTD